MGDRWLSDLVGTKRDFFALSIDVSPNNYVQFNDGLISVTGVSGKVSYNGTLARLTSHDGTVWHTYSAFTGFTLPPLIDDVYHLGDNSNRWKALWTTLTGFVAFANGSQQNVIAYTDGVGPRFEDATNGGNSVTFNIQALTVPRAVTFPDASGTVTLLGNTSTGSGSIVLATGPTLSNPVVGTQTAGDNTTKAASTAFVTAAVAAGGGGGGGGGPSDAITKPITQSNSFVVGNIVRLSGTSYILAKADTAANAEAIGMVSATGNPFTITTGGFVTGLSGLTAGAVYFLDPSTAGVITTTEPSTTGQVSKPVFVAATASSGWFFNMRGMMIGGGGSGGGASLAQMRALVITRAY